MMDLALVFTEDTSLASAITSDIIDLGGKSGLGGFAKPMYLALAFPTAATGTGSVTFNVQDSANGSTFATKLAATVAAADMKKPIYIPMPVEHEQYLRMTSTVSGTVGGKVTAYIADGTVIPANVKVEGMDIVPSVD